LSIANRGGSTRERTGFGFPSIESSVSKNR
jgi:hypothetical protein